MATSKAPPASSPTSARSSTAPPRTKSAPNKNSNPRTPKTSTYRPNSNRPSPTSTKPTSPPPPCPRRATASPNSKRSATNSKSASTPCKPSETPSANNKTWLRSHPRQTPKNSRPYTATTTRSPSASRPSNRNSTQPSRRPPTSTTPSLTRYGSERDALLAHIQHIEQAQGGPQATNENLDRLHAKIQTLEDQLSAVSEAFEKADSIAQRVEKAEGRQTRRFARQIEHTPAQSESELDDLRAQLRAERNHSADLKIQLEEANKQSTDSQSLQQRIAELEAERDSLASQAQAAPADGPPVPQGEGGEALRTLKDELEQLQIALDDAIKERDRLEQELQSSSSFNDMGGYNDYDDIGGGPSAHEIFEKFNDAASEWRNNVAVLADQVDEFSRVHAVAHRRHRKRQRRRGCAPGPRGSLRAQPQRGLGRLARDHHDLPREHRERQARPATLPRCLRPLDRARSVRRRRACTSASSCWSTCGGCPHDACSRRVQP